MAQYRTRSRFVIPPLIIALGLSIYFASDIEQSSTVTPEVTSRKPNAIASGTKFREFNEQGALELEIDSTTSYYFRDERLIETVEPHIRYHNDQGELLTLDGKTGQLKTDSGLLTLEQEVELTRTDTLDRKLVIRTEDLVVDTENDFISTSHEVTITQGEHSLSSQGLKASLSDRKLELPKRVRGTYDLAN